MGLAKTDCFDLIFIARIFLPEVDPALVHLFHYGADTGDTRLIIELLNAGVSVDSRDERGYTALHRAAFCNHTNVVNKLLINGAHVNAQNYNGMTPLHQAVTYNSTDAMKVLLQHGADPSIVDNTGETVFDLALK